MYELVFASHIQRWQQILDLFNIRDIYFTRDYLISALKLDPGEAMLFYYTDEEGHGEILYAFIKRKLEKGGNSYYDITTPFGYGGPVLRASNDAEKLTANFLNIFSEYCRGEKILAEFIRFHPVLNNSAYFKEELELIPVYETHTINLESVPLGGEGTAASPDDETEKNGLSFRKLGTVKHMFDFLILYYSTIRGNDEKDSYYFFTNDYFEGLVSSLGPDLHLFGIYKENKLLVATYVLAKGETIYHHLSGKSEEGIPPEAESELLYGIAEWGASNGFRYFHIANRKMIPVQAEEKLIKNSRVSPYSIARRIHEPELYSSYNPPGKSELIKRYGNV